MQTAKLNQHLPRLQRDFDSIVEARNKNQPISYKVFSLLENIRCTEYLSTQWILTDDEPAAARMVFNVLKLLLDQRGDSTALDVATALHGALVYDRWRYCVQDADDCFALVSTIIAASENFTIAPFAHDIFKDIALSAAHPDWPFPTETPITAQMFSDGDTDTLESMCTAAFGRAWWQLVDPINTHGSVIDMIVTTRPPLVGFVAPANQVTLPPLLGSGTSL